MKILHRSNSRHLSRETERQVVAGVLFEKSVRKKLDEQIDLSRYLSPTAAGAAYRWGRSESRSVKMTFTFLVRYRFARADKNKVRRGNVRRGWDADLPVIVLVTGERCVKNCSLPTGRRLHTVSSHNFSHPHLWFSETYMKGRGNNRLSGNRNSPFVERLERTRKLDKHIDHHLHSIAKFKHISSGRVLVYVPNELSFLTLCQKWKQEWAPAIREYID